MITLTSATQSQEEMAAAIAAHGITPKVEDPAPQAPEDKATSSEPQPAIPGDQPSGTEGTTDPAPEAGKPQVTQAAPPVEVPAEPKPEAKFETRRKQLERKLERAYEDLDQERGSHKSLQTKVSELEAQIAALKPTPPKEPQLPAEPEMPTLSALEFDQEKYDAAMRQYHKGMKAYFSALQDKGIADALAKRDRDDSEKRAKDEADAFYADFLTRRDQQAEAELADFRELAEAAPELHIPSEIELKIFQSDIPAHLLHFFMKDASEDNGKELSRLSRLTPLLQGREMSKLETRLAIERDNKLRPAAAAPVVAAPPEPKQPEPAPAKPPVKATPEAPINPLGGRTTGKTPSLSDAKDAKSYLALRNQNVNR